MQFSEAANTPITGVKVVNIAYILILNTGVMGKACEQWEYMQVVLQTWQAFKGPFFTILQALSDTQEGNSGKPWVWGFIKSCTGNIIPSDDYGCSASTCMCSNGRQGGNEKPHQHKSNPVSEPHSSTRDNFGYFKSATGITGPVKGK